MKKNLIQLFIVIITLNVYSQNKKINYINDLIIYNKLSNENLIIFNDSLNLNGLIKADIEYKFGKSVVGSKYFFKINYLRSDGELIYSHEINKKYDEEGDGDGYEIKNENNFELFEQNLLFCKEIENVNLLSIYNQITKPGSEWIENINDLYKLEYLRNKQTVNYNYLDNKLTSITYYSDYGKKIEIVKIIYDSSKRICKQIFYNNIDEDSNIANVNNVAIYTYDKNSNLIKIINPKDGKSKLIEYNINNIVSISEVEFTIKPYQQQPFRGSKMDANTLDENYYNISFENRQQTFETKQTKDYKIIKSIELDNGEKKVSTFILPKLLKVENFNKYLTKFGANNLASFLLTNE